MGDLKPISTPWDNDPLMYPAFIGCVHWALGKDEIVDAFRKKSGNTWQLGRTPIDRMIDRSTGVERDFMQQFSDYVADEIFGRPEAAS